MKKTPGIAPGVFGSCPNTGADQLSPLAPPLYIAKLPQISSMTA